MLARIAGDFWFLAAVAAIAAAFLRFVVCSAVVGGGLRRMFGWLEDRCGVYQCYRVPERSEGLQENHLYKKVSIYVNSLPSLQDSDLANLVSGRKSGEILLHPEPGRPVVDSFLGAQLSWRHDPGSFVLKIRRRDKRRVLRAYLQHLRSVADEIEVRRREGRLYTNTGGCSGMWRSIPFTHPATIETVAMDPEIKAKVRSDLEAFLKSKQYYRRLGRVWKRGYLLHGPAGTGKTSFAAAMAKFLQYDLYDVDLARVGSDSDLKSLLVQTMPGSVILVEDVDRFLHRPPPDAVSVAGVLSFSDGIFSYCGEERVMVFTATRRDRLDAALLRPGRLDVHIHFPACDFPAFKALARSYLGVRDHKLFPAAEEAFNEAATAGGGGAAGLMSPAEIGEILILNRGSPSRAIKSVISAVKARKAAAPPDVRCGGCESAAVAATATATAREIRKLYGVMRLRSCGRKGDAFEPTSGPT